MSKDKNENTNRYLWQARQRSGLPRKTIAFLLGRKFTDEISRYESGQRTPTLQTALKLEIIYRVPVRLLFYEEFINSSWQIRERGSRFKKLFPKEILSAESLDSLERGEYCTYAELLNTPNLPLVESEKVRSHLIYLANKINETNGVK
jgi:transcriptional regulator with XRE-family HTH domain